MIRQHLLNAGMDLDSMPEAAKVFVRRNCRSTRSGDGGAGSVRPVRSLRLVSNLEQGADRLVIGRYTDEGRQRLFFFVYEGSGLQNHGVYCYDRREDKIYTLLRDAQVPLGLDPDHWVSASMIGGHLVFTDNLNPPKKFDVERAIRTYDNTYVSPDGTVPVIYEGTLMERDITLIRRPGSTPLTIEKVESVNEPIDPIDGNFIDGKSFQFTYRFRYRDGNYSVSAPYSKLSVHNRKEQDFDAIKVTLEEEVIDYEVYGVEFMVRLGNTGSWFTIEEINRDKDGDAPFDAHNGGTNHVFYYDGRNYGTAVSDADGYLPFHDVPLKSQGIDIAKNRVFLANNVKGYDSVSGVTMGGAEINLDPETIIGTYFKITITCPSGTDEYVRVKITDEYGEVKGWYTFITPLTEAQLVAQFDAGTLLPFVLTNPESRQTGSIEDNNAVAGTFPVCGENFIDAEFEEYTVLNPIVEGLGDIRHNQRVFKDGQRYRFGTVFFDEFGRTPGISSDIVDIDIPRRNYPPPGSSLGSTFVNQVDVYALASEVPEWAESWGLAMSKVDLFFAGGFSNTVRYAKKEEDGSYTFEQTYVPSGDYTDGVGIGLEKFIEYGVGWVFAEGDQVRIISTPFNLNPQREYVLKVIGQQGDYLICSYEDIGRVFRGLNGSGLDYFVEVSRVSGVDDERLYEIGHNYPVINAGQPDREMYFPFVDGGGNGYVKVDGDAHFVQRDFVGGEGFDSERTKPVISMNPDDRNWTLWNTDRGRPYVRTYGKQERYTQEVAWGQQLLRGTKVNGLNDFRSGDVAYVDEAVGELQSLVFTSGSKDQGNVMLAMGRSGVASLYIGRTQIYSDTAAADIVSTADVVGAVNVLDGGFGTFSPGSVFENGGRVYWFSTNQPAFVRYNLNGPYPISEKGMASVAKYLAEKSARDGTRVVGGFDTYYGEALWALPPNHAESTIVLEDIKTLVVQKTGLLNFTVLTLTEKGSLYKIELESGVPVLLGNFQDMWNGPVTTAGQTSWFFVAKNNAQSIQLRPVSLSDLGSEVTIRVYKVREYPHNVTNGLPYVLAFNDNEPSKWELAYTMNPDAMASVGDLMCWFFRGDLYVQDGDGVCNFFGVDFPASVSFPSGDLNRVSVFQGLGIAGTLAPYAHIRTEYDRVQGSDIKEEKFVLVEGVHYHEIMNDRLTPGAASFGDGLFRGNPIRSRIAKVLLEFKKGVDFLLTTVSVNTRESKGHKIS